MVAARVGAPNGNIFSHGLALVRSSRQRSCLAIDRSFALYRHNFAPRISSAQEADSQDGDCTEVTAASWTPFDRLQMRCFSPNHLALALWLWRPTRWTRTILPRLRHWDPSPNWPHRRTRTNDDVAGATTAETKPLWMARRLMWSIG